MFDIFHNLNVSLRHTKISTPAADWGLVFCMAQGHGYQCKKIEHAAVHRGLLGTHIVCIPQPLNLSSEKPVSKFSFSHILNVCRYTLETAVTTEGTEIRPAAECGPIILCLDTSGSMMGARETIAKAMVRLCAS
jgi:hypothetical protein